MSPADFLALVAKLPANVLEFSAEGFSVKLQPVATSAAKTPAQLQADAELRSPMGRMIDSLTSSPPEFRE